MIPLAFTGNDYYVPSKDKKSPFERYVTNFNLLDGDARSRLILTTITALSAAAVVTKVLIDDLSTQILILVSLVGLGGLCFALWLAAWVFAHDEGPSELRAISEPIQEGSEGFFAVQYGAILSLSIVTAISLFLMYLFKEPIPGPNSLSSLSMALITASTFLVGAGCSAVAGYAGMWVSVRANVRVAAAARRCYNESIQLCFRAGAFASLINVSLVVLGISGIILFLRLLFPGLPLTAFPLLLVGFGFGSSLVAMFAQLGGGIYTKGADVGADLVGKVEVGIPEDDPRNPAVIADLVGDNVGDCAGQCADTFESIAAEIMSAMILGGALAEQKGFNVAGFVLFPLAVHCMDIVVSSIGVMLVSTNPGRVSDFDGEDPLWVMKRAYLVTLLLAGIGFTILTKALLGVNGWLWYAGCGGVGMTCAYLFVIITQYYTDYNYPKVKSIAEASLTGPATNIIAGLSVGLESTALPVLVIAVGLISSYYMGIAAAGESAGSIAGSSSHSLAGLFGTAVATMGMLCTAGFVLAMSNFGPIADNAGGIVEMAQQPESVRAVTDRLDAVGNVTKANTKGFSVGSASLACFLLFAAFMDEVSVYTGEKFVTVDLANPEVFVGGLLGAMLVFLFAGWAMVSVGRTAQEVVFEVRRQFKERPGIMTFQEKPDYQRCVAIVSKAALKEMVKPGVLAVSMPLFIGLIFRALGAYRNDNLLGPQALAAFLMFATSTGIITALFLNNAGGAWDNAKKYIETGAMGGKGSDTHKAAVVGDTVGDPCKDTAGPSVHVLIKLLSTVTMVLTPLFCTPKSIHT